MSAPTPGVNLTDAQRGTALYRTAEARRYIRNLVAASPRQVATGVDVINATTVHGEDPRNGSVETLLLDLSDGTQISLAIRRYVP